MEYTNTGAKDTRSGFGEALLELGRQNKNVVALCADLGFVEDGCLCKGVS
jgi:transketolase C-terminal domain/subunit